MLCLNISRCGPASSSGAASSFEPEPLSWPYSFPFPDPTSDPKSNPEQGLFRRFAYTPAQEALGSDVVGHDASGNPILKDIGTYLRDNIKKHISVRVYTPQRSFVILA